jgi:hypothetical protein
MRGKVDFFGVGRGLNTSMLLIFHVLRDADSGHRDTYEIQASPVSAETSPVLGSASIENLMLSAIIYSPARSAEK